MRRALLLTSLLLAACTVPATGDDDSVGDDDSSGDDDASGQPDAGGSQATCAVPEQLGTTMLNLTAERRNQPGSQGALQYYALVGDFDSDAKPDKLSLQLWDQNGAFTADVVAGTYTIGGAETDLNTCGVCTTVLGNFTPPAEQFYKATGGSVTITSVEPTLAGTLSDVQLVQFDGATGATTPDGCTTTIASLEFSATVTIVDGGGGGGGGGGQ